VALPWVLDGPQERKTRAEAGSRRLAAQTGLSAARTAAIDSRRAANDDGAPGTCPSAPLL